MSDDKHSISEAALDDALGKLPRDIEPSRDLWPGVRAVIESTPVSAHAQRRGGLGWWGQIAAGVALVVVSSVATYAITRQAMQPPVAATHVLATNVTGDIATDYLSARAELDRQFSERIASLPPATRARLVGNLADVRRAADQILVSLVEHPSDSLLYELLISTYQSEAQLLANAETLSLPVS
jgi:hypothetical protein